METRCKYFRNEQPAERGLLSRINIPGNELLLVSAFSVLIIGGLYFRPLTFAAFGLALAYLCYLPPEKSIEFMVFLMSFQSVFKFSSTSTSVFTFLQVIPIAKIILRKDYFQISKYCIGSLAVLLLYTAVFSFSGPLPMIRMVLGLVLLAVILQGNMIGHIDIKRLVLFYSTGIIVSSVLALTNAGVVKPYVSAVVVRLSDGSALTRFSGLYMNANYYSMEVSLALAAHIVLYKNKESTLAETLLFGSILTVFGVMSQSKTFVISLVLILLFLFSYQVRKDPRTLVLLAAGAALAFVFRDRLAGILGKNFSRFFELQEDSTSLSDVTTGRSDIWALYLRTIFANPNVMLLGAGIEVQLHVAPHNAFIEMLFDLGIVGSAIYINALFSIKQHVPERMPFLIYAATLLLRMNTANVFFYNNVYYYYLLLFLLMDKRTYQGIKIQQAEDEKHVSRFVLDVTI